MNEKAVENGGEQNEDKYRGKYTEKELRDRGEVSLLVLSDLC